MPEQFRARGRTEPERRDLVVVTPDAAARVREIQAETGAHYLRVSVVVTGYDGVVPTGFQNKLDLVDDVDPETDYLCRSRGISVLIDRRTAWLFAKGVTVGWDIGPDGRGGFSIRTPDETGTG